MSFLITSRSLRILLLITFLIGGAGLIARSARTSTHSTVVAPLRLRLKVEHTTLRSGQATKIWAEFLDGNYDQVPNDGTRVVDFGIVPARGASGSISPAQGVKVKPGEMVSPNATFTSGQPGRVLIRARSEGLDSDETFLLVTRQAPGFVTQVLGLFETVAYAQDQEEFSFLRKKVTVSAGSRAKFQVGFGSARAGTKVRISTDPPAAIFYEDQVSDGDDMEITLREDGGDSKGIWVSSPDTGQVKVFAEARSSGLHASAIAEFTEPKPHRICFIDERPMSLPPGASPCLTKWDIPSTLTDFPITIQLADDRGNLIKSDGKRKITLRRGNTDDPVAFEPEFLEFSQNQDVATGWIHLTSPVWRNELTLMAGGSADQHLTPARTSIFIRSPIERVTVTGPSEVKRGSTNAAFTVGLVDKDGKPSLADSDRRINLSVTGGRLSQTQVTISKNQDSATVQYFPSFATGKVVLTAQSFGLTEATTGIVLITPLSWLILAALFGGSIGGVARYLPKGDTVGNYLPTFKLSWKSVAGSIAGSLTSGFIFYLAMKFGFSQAMGFALPASLDVGSGLAAFFLACLGGYMGVGTVFDGITSLWQRLSQKKNVSTPPVASGVDHG